MTNTETYKTERIVRDLGSDWGRSIQDQITEAAAAYAQAGLERMKDAATRNSISVRLPMWVTMIFPIRDGQVVRGDGGGRGQVICPAEDWIARPTQSGATQ